MSKKLLAVALSLALLLITTTLVAKSRQSA